MRYCLKMKETINVQVKRNLERENLFVIVFFFYLLSLYECSITIFIFIVF